MTRASKASRAAALEKVKTAARAVGLDARWVVGGMFDGFMEIYRPETDEPLAQGVGIDFWLEGLGVAFEFFAPAKVL